MKEKIILKNFLLVPLLGIFVLSLFIPSCESTRTGPELPVLPTPPPTPFIISGYVKDASTNNPILGATVTIFKTDGTNKVIVLTDNAGKYEAPVSSFEGNPTKLIITATASGYAYSTVTAEINYTTRSVSTHPIFLDKLQVVTTPVTASSGGTAAAPSPQSLSGENTTVTIPPNALSKDTTITVAPLKSSSVPPLGLTNQAPAAAADFGPDGTIFSIPVTIKLPLPLKLTAGKTVSLRYYNKTTGQWISEGTGTVDASGLVVSGQISHFTVWLAPTDVRRNISVLGLPIEVEIGKGTPDQVKALRPVYQNSFTPPVSEDISGDWLLDVIAEGEGGIVFNKDLTYIPVFSVPEKPTTALPPGYQWVYQNPKLVKITTTKTGTVSWDNDKKSVAVAYTVVSFRIDGNYYKAQHSQGVGG